MLSDLCPIGGYAKAPYIVFSALLGTIALAVLGSMRSELKIEQARSAPFGPDTSGAPSDGEPFEGSQKTTVCPPSFCLTVNHLTVTV